MPYDRMGNAGPIEEDRWSSRRRGIREPEEILPLMETLPSDEALEAQFSMWAVRRG